MREVHAIVKRDTELHLWEVWINGRLLAQRILSKECAEEIKLLLLKERE